MFIYFKQFIYFNLFTETLVYVLIKFIFMYIFRL